MIINFLIVIQGTRMKMFTNISNAAVAKMLGLELVGRECVIQKAEDTHERYLVAQINLYLILQFHANSNTGLTDLLSVKDLAEQLSCTTKTVYRSLDILEQGDFIQVTGRPEFGYVSVQILNIGDMYKRRGEGGKGYFVCNQDLLQVFLETKAIAVLRASLTAMIVFATKQTFSASKIVDRVRIGLNEIAMSFPVSSRLCDIKAACDASGSFGSLFERVNPDLKKSIFIKLQQNYDAKQIKQQIRVKAKQAIFAEIDEINDIIRDINTDIHEDNMIHAMNAGHLWRHRINVWDCLDPMHQTTMLPLLELTSDVKNDCLTIAQDYGIDTVIDALRLYYQQYKLSDAVHFVVDKAKSLGGLIWTIVMELCQMKTATA